MERRATDNASASSCLQPGRPAPHRQPAGGDGPGVGLVTGPVVSCWRDGRGHGRGLASGALPRVLCLGADVRFIIVLHGWVIVLVRMSGRHVLPLGAVPQVVHDVSARGCERWRHGCASWPSPRYRAVRPGTCSKRLAGWVWRVAAPAWHVAGAADYCYRDWCPGTHSHKPLAAHGNLVIQTVRTTETVPPRTMVFGSAATVSPGPAVPDTSAGPLRDVEVPGAAPKADIACQPLCRVTLRPAPGDCCAISRPSAPARCTPRAAGR